MRTITCYKLFQTKRTAPGRIFPLFIGKDKPTPIGEWVPAQFLPTDGFAPRPGWHVGPLPKAQHLMCKDGTMPASRVWAQVEILADVDYTPLAAIAPTKDLRGQVPHGGYYRFPRPINQGGEWIIAGQIRVLRLLSEEEVQQILNNAHDTQAALV
jgi:hypothetical protein